MLRGVEVRVRPVIAALGVMRRDRSAAAAATVDAYRRVRRRVTVKEFQLHGPQSSADHAQPKPSRRAARFAQRLEQGELSRTIPPHTLAHHLVVALVHGAPSLPCLACGRLVARTRQTSRHGPPSSVELSAFRAAQRRSALLSYRRDTGRLLSLYILIERLLALLVLSSIFCSSQRYRACLCSRTRRGRVDRKSRVRCVAKTLPSRGRRQNGPRRLGDSKRNGDGGCPRTNHTVVANRGFTRLAPTRSPGRTRARSPTDI